jgi:SAM-dependent methyltransferase
MSLALRNDDAIDVEDVRLADMWSISGQLLHTEAYRRSHADLLAAAIGDRALSVHDAACGLGFPLIELHDLHFTHLSGSDADLDLIQAFREKAVGWAPDLSVATWQLLPRQITRQFDVVLAVDAAIGFMDSWLPGEMRQGPASIFARVTDVLRNFYAVTKPGGRFFIGLQKNNHKGNRYYPMFVGRMQVAGPQGPTLAEAHWNMTYDWETRIKTWVNIVRYEGREYAQTRRSYLFDLAELSGFLTEAGFDRVERLTTPDDLYEDILIAHRRK